MAKTQVYGSIPLVITDQGDSYQLNAADVESLVVAGVTETFPKERLDIMRERARAFGYVISIITPDGNATAPESITLPQWGG